MELPSGSGAPTEPDWVFWKDFSKYNTLPRARTGVGSFTIDLMAADRELGPEDNNTREREEEEVVVLEEEEPLTIVGQRTQSASVGKKRKAQQVDGMELMGEVRKMLVEETAKTPQDLMIRSILDGMQALLMGVTDVRFLRRISSEVLAYTEEVIDQYL